jgi:hypothetical protein
MDVGFAVTVKVVGVLPPAKDAESHAALGDTVTLLANELDTATVSEIDTVLLGCALKVRLVGLVPSVGFGETVNVTGTKTGELLIPSPAINSDPVYTPAFKPAGLTLSVAVVTPALEI